MPQDNPPLLDKTMNTTESTPRNMADVLASGLANIANNVKPDGSDISIDVPGMSANNVDDGFSELKQSLDDIGTVVNGTQTGNISCANNTVTEVGSITLNKGTYIITAFLNWPANATGYRQLMFNEVNADPSRNKANTILSPGNKIAYQEYVTIESIANNNTTIKMHALQNSGGALSAYPYIKAIRIA